MAQPGIIIVIAVLLCYTWFSMECVLDDLKIMSFVANTVFHQLD